MSFQQVNGYENSGKLYSTYENQFWVTILLGDPSLARNIITEVGR